MLGWLALLLLPALQDPGIDDLLQRLEKANYHSLEAAIDALVGKGDGVEPAVRRRSPTAAPEFLRRLALVLRRLELQRKLKELHPPPKPVDYAVRDKPLAEVLDEVEKWLGLPILRDGLPDEKVTLSLAGVQPLQALDAFHKATGHTCLPFDTRRFDKDREIHVMDPPKAKLVKQPWSSWPAIMAGRFRVSVLSTKVNRADSEKGPGSKSTVDLLIQAPFTSQPHDLVHITVGRFVDDQGREVALIPDGGPAFGRMGIGGPRQYFNRSFTFAPPAADAKTISLVGCRMRLGFAVEQDYLTFERPEDSVGTVLEWHGAKIRLQEFQPAHGWMRLVLDKSGQLEPTIQRMESFEFKSWQVVDRVEVVHEDGRITVPENKGAQQEGPVYRKRMICFGEPKVKAIRLAVAASYAYEDLEFDLRDIPLPGAK
jgi:hypothetical protein